MEAERQDSNGEASGDEDSPGDVEVESCQRQVEILEEKLTQISSCVNDEAAAEGRGINMDKQELKLTELRENLVKVEEELHGIIDNPHIQELLDMDLPSPAATVVHSKAEMLVLSCQGTITELDNLTVNLRRRIAQRKEDILGDLESLENWLDSAYSVILSEPNRFQYSPNIVDARYLRTYSQDSTYSSEEERRRTSSELKGLLGRDPAEGYDNGGSENGEEVRQGGVTPIADDNTNLENDIEKMLGSPEGSHKADVTEYSVNFTMSPNYKEEEEEEEIVEEEGLINGVGEGVNYEEEDEEQINGGEWVNGSEGGISSPSQTETMTSGESSEMDTSQSQSEGESENIDWIKDLCLVPLFHAPALRDELALHNMNMEEMDLDHLLAELEKLWEELPIQSQKVKKVKANVHFIINTSPAESAAEYNERLHQIQRRWDLLDSELKIRLMQLNFEKTEKSTLESILEAMSELDSQPQANVLPEDVEDKYTDLMDFIISVEQFNSLKTDQLASLESAFNKLEEEELPDCQDIVESFKEAYSQLARKIEEQKQFLEKCLEQWTEFKKLYSRCEVWLEKAELLVSKEAYGFSQKSTEDYLQEIRFLRESITGQEELEEQLITLGKAMLADVEEGGEAERYIDERLSDVESRWSELVTPHTGKFDSREAAVNKILVDWRGYSGMLSGTRSFIDQMSKMVGHEPRECSNGDSTLLPTYITYSNQLKRMEVQYNRLVALGNRLASNPHVGSQNAFQEELEDLASQWGPLKDNVMDSLDILIREYNDWIMVKLQHMSELVTQADEFIKREVSFIQTFPLDDILTEDAEELLKETDSLVAGQDQLNQMETECTQIEEKLLERQIQQETSTEFSGSQGDLEYPSTTKEKTRLQEEREKIQADSESLLPILNILYLQLQLLQNIQDNSKLISKATEFVGDRLECESLLTEIELKLSDDNFEKLHSQAYDAGTVMEEVQETMGDMEGKVAISLPSCTKLVGVNKTLTSEIGVLSSSTEQAKLRLQLFIQWWDEFQRNCDDVIPWLDGAETALRHLQARYTSSHPPRVSPIDLLQELKELSSEIEDKSIIVCALEATGQNILEEMELKGRDPGEMPTQISDVRSRWEGLRSETETLSVDIQSSAQNFDTFLKRLTEFLNWLSEFHGRFYDEVCVRVPPKASEEVISLHKNQLEVFRAEVITHVPELEWMKAESKEWEEHLVPETMLTDLPSPSEASPPPEDEAVFPPTSLLPYIKGRVQGALDKWRVIQQLLIDREQQLELSTGSYQAFSEHAENLLNWLRGKLEMSALSGHPPADLEIIEGYQRDIQFTKDELSTKRASLNALEHMVSSLKGQVTSSNAERVVKMMEEMRGLWAELEQGTQTRDEVLCPWVDRLREFWHESSELEVWIKGKETELEECGTIGANLDRCQEQTIILEELDGLLLGNKQTIDRSQEQAQSLCNDCESGSGTKIQDRASDHEKRYTYLCEETAERKEICEEAISNLQALLGKIKVFEDWLTGVEETLEERKKEKRPIGTLQTELDEHYDFMREIENHTEDYLVLVPEGRGLMDKYLPNDWLGGVMQALSDRWEGYVDNLNERCHELMALIKLWEHFEKDVKELLSWIMSEADSFSKDVTTQGDKGVVDHMETCKTFMVMLEGKKVTIDDITEQASLLKAQDGEKKNGTSDVESRWNDVQMHWNSSCKLLSETLLHLEATEAEMRHVLLIREEEFEWLETCEECAGIQERTRGDLDLLQTEIEKHESLLEELRDHDEARDFILNTVPYLVEHSRKKDREEMKLKADEFNQRHEKLGKSLNDHIVMLKDSIPFWKKFNSNVEELSQWLEEVNSGLVSDKVQFGNATVTEESLIYCQGLQTDIYAHKSFVHDVAKLGDTLSKYVVSADQQFVEELIEKLKNRKEFVTKETEEKTELLEERLTSWRVFPVEEARVVQQFLEQVECEVEIEELPDDISSEELLERLERLENLQVMQISNQDKVSTIDKSAQGADVQQALQRNPDISKERSNLLQGWSNMSSSLKEKIILMKQKAKMVQDLEEELKKAERAITDYQNHLDTPLPPSVLLVQRRQEILDEAVTLHNTSQSCLSDLQNRLDQYDMLETSHVNVPQHFKDKTSSLFDQLGDLSSRDQQQTNQIASILHSWEEFSSRTKELTKWVRSRNTEVESLKVMEDFATEFSSHETRLQLLTEDLDGHRHTFFSVNDSAPQHTTGDEPEVQDVLKKFTALKNAWTRIENGVKELFERSKPWKNLTDLFEELSCWLDELTDQVDQDEADIAGIDEAGGGDLSDKIVNFKDYLKRAKQQDANFSQLSEGVTELLPQEVCDNHVTCQELSRECNNLKRKWVELKERLERALVTLHEKEVMWKEHATNSIRRVHTLQHELNSFKTELKEKEEMIRNLQAQRSPSPRSPVKMVMTTLILGLFAALYLFTVKKPGTFRPT